LIAAGRQFIQFLPQNLLKKKTKVKVTLEEVIKKKDYLSEEKTYPAPLL
jgi:hypothetical protein